MERCRNLCRTNKQSGFSLVELLIVVAIITILTAIGYPSYTDYVTRSTRQAAKGAIYQIADRQEQFFLDNRAYAANLSSLGYAADTLSLDREGQWVAAGSADRTYNVDVTNTTATTYTVRAVPQLVQAERDTDCMTLTLTHTNERDQSGASDKCW